LLEYLSENVFYSESDLIPRCGLTQSEGHWLVAFH